MHTYDLLDEQLSHTYRLKEEWDKLSSKAKLERLRIKNPSDDDQDVKSMTLQLDNKYSLMLLDRQLAWLKKVSEEADVLFADNDIYLDHNESCSATIKKLLIHFTDWHDGMSYFFRSELNQMTDEEKNHKMSVLTPEERNRLGRFFSSEGR